MEYEIHTNLKHLQGFYKNPSVLNFLLLRNQDGRLSKRKVLAFGLGCVLECISYMAVSAVVISIFSSTVIVPLSTLNIVKVIVISIASYYLSCRINIFLEQKSCQFTIAMRDSRDFFQDYKRSIFRNECSLQLAERHVKIGIEKNESISQMLDALPLPKSCCMLIQAYYENEYLENAYKRLKRLSPYYTHFNLRYPETMRQRRKKITNCAIDYIKEAVKDGYIDKAIRWCVHLHDLDERISLYEAIFLHCRQREDIHAMITCMYRIEMRHPKTNKEIEQESILMRKNLIILSDMLNDRVLEKYELADILCCLCGVFEFIFFSDEGIVLYANFVFSLRQKLYQKGYLLDDNNEMDFIQERRCLEKQFRQYAEKCGLKAMSKSFLSKLDEDAYVESLTDDLMEHCFTLNKNSCG